MYLPKNLTEHSQNQQYFHQEIFYENLFVYRDSIGAVFIFNHCEQYEEHVLYCSIIKIRDIRCSIT